MKRRSLLYRSSLLAALVACLLTGCSDRRNKVEGPAADGASQAEGSSSELAELRDLIGRLNEQVAASSRESNRQRAEIIELLVEIRTELRK